MTIAEELIEKCKREEKLQIAKKIHNIGIEIYKIRAFHNTFI